MTRDRGRARCPDDARLLGDFLGELDPETSAGVRAHVAACALCRMKRTALAGISEEFRTRAAELPESLSMEEEATLRRMAGDEVRKARPHPVPARLWAAAAAAALLLVSTAGFLFLLRSGMQEALRGRPGRLLLLEPSGKLERPPSVFRWEARRDADIYRFEVLDERMRPVITRGVKSAAVTLSAAERAMLAPGGTFRWDVEAMDERGRSLAAGGGTFVLEPAPGTLAEAAGDGPRLAD